MKLSADVGEAVVSVPDPTLTAGEGGISTKFDRFVVGKIFASRVVNRETLRLQLPRILQTRGDPDIEIVGDNLFVVVFANDRDRRHALLDGPWHFFDSLMMFEEPKGLEKPSDVVFSKFTTWIQCHNLPLVCMNPIMVRRIAEHVGNVEEIDTGDGGNCLGQYARVRVTRDLNKPLQRCVGIMVGEDSEKHIILIRYERLPDYCSACGRVGHVVRHCDDTKVDKQKNSFGTWLRATRTFEARRGRGEPQRGGSPEKERASSNQNTSGRALVLAGEKSRGTVHGENSHALSNAAAQSSDENNMIIEEEVEKSKESSSSTAEKLGAENNVARSEGLQRGGGDGGPANNQLHLSPIRVKNILLSPGSTKKKKEGWKRRARSIGKSQGEGGGKNNTIGLKGKTTAGKNK